MWLPEEERFPRDAGTLAREVDALIKLNDVQAVQRYREQLESKWWEPGIVALLFISGLGFILTIFKLIPDSQPLLFWFVFGWFVLFVLSLMLTIEFLLLKIAALRRLHEMQAKLLEDLARRAAAEKAREGASVQAVTGAVPTGGRASFPPASGQG